MRPIPQKEWRMSKEGAYETDTTPGSLSTLVAVTEFDILEESEEWEESLQKEDFDDVGVGLEMTIADEVAEQGVVSETKRVTVESPRFVTPDDKSNSSAFAFIWNRLFRRYFALKLFGIILALYTALLSFTYKGTFGKAGGLIDPEVGYIVDSGSPDNTDRGVILSKGIERAVVASNGWEMVCLGVAKLTAFFMYPGAVFITKFRATMDFVSHTPLSLFTYEDLHELHVFSGWTILINGLAHTFFHLLRWASQGNMQLLGHFSGLSGVLITVSLLLVCLPMLFAKQSLRYEIRKALHYFFVLFAVGLCFHAPTSAFPNGGFSTIMFSTIIVWWILDYSYTLFFMTEKIESSIFHVVPTGVQLTMHVSERFQRHEGGYCYVNFPWISKTEWHAFSLFENPSHPEERQIFIQKTGDWTSKLHSALQRDTSRPVWVQGPYSSPFDSAVEYDNQILVAGGIGITPAVSVMRSHSGTRRRSNLIWACRDPHMLEFFMRRAEFSVRGWNLVFYTGKEPTAFDSESEVITSSGARVHLIRARPDFQTLIPNLIYSIESGISVPEAYIPDSKIEALKFLRDKLAELDKESILNNRDKIRALVNEAESLGLLFSDLVTEFFGEDVTESLHQSISQGENSTDPLFDPNTDPRSGHLLAKIRGLSRHTSSRNVFEGGLSRHTSLRNVFEGGGAPVGHRSMRSVLSGSGSRRALLKAASIRSLTPKMQREESVHTLAWKQMTEAADEWARDHVPLFKPWEDDSAEAMDFLAGMDKEVLRSWGVLYCGSKSPLAANVEKFSALYKIQSHMESFAW